MENKSHRWIVFNCPVTQVLGRYATESEARAAADWFGRCSFPYHLSPEELARMDAAA